MAIRKQRGTINGKCVERIQFYTPEGVWVAHPTRGEWAPCGTYPRTTAGGFGKAVASKSAVNIGNSISIPARRSSVQYVNVGPPTSYAGLGTKDDYTGGEFTTSEMDKLKKLALLVAVFVAGWYLFKKM